MKKKLLSLVCLVLTFAMTAVLLTGCGGSAETSSAPQSESAPEATDASSQAGGESAPAFQDALKGVTLTVGTSGTYAPFSYFKEDGTTLQGFDVEFLGELQKLLGFSIKSDKLQDMDYGPLTTSLSQGQLDVVAAALCATDERKKTMNFTDTYYDAGIVVVVGEANNDIKGVDDLKDGKYTVAVQAGTIAYEYAAANLPEECLKTFDSQSLAYKAVEGGQADATIYDAPGTAYSIKTGEIKLKIVGDEFYNGQAPYAIAISFKASDANPDIVQNFNDAIAYLQENGTIDELKKKWCE